MNSQLLAQSPGLGEEQRVLWHGVSWQQYQSLLDGQGDGFPTLRLS